MSKHESRLKCPVCDSSLKVQILQSIICPNRHTFDIAKQGHINVMTHSIQTNYNRTLFEARRKVIVTSNLFQSFHTEIIHKYTATTSNLSIVDMGSGEGSHLYTISNALQLGGKKLVTAVGIDISKDGILEAAKNYEDICGLLLILRRHLFIIRPLT